MLYITNHTLPDRFRNDNGYNLCLLWFLTKFGEEYNVDLLDSFDKKVCNLEIKELEPYTLPLGGNEIIKINGDYNIGDGYGNVIYSPCRKEYSNGNFRIEAKYSVEKKV